MSDEALYALCKLLNELYGGGFVVYSLATGAKDIRFPVTWSSHRMSEAYNFYEGYRRGYADAIQEGNKNGLI